MNHFTIKKLIPITLLFSICAFGSYPSDISRSVPLTNSIGSFTYSSIQLPSGYGPTDSSITLLQSIGIRAYFCQAPQGISPDMVSVSLVLKNRFASRFCNNHHGQTILNMVMYHIKTIYDSKWMGQVIPSIGTTNINFVFTTTSSGACIKISAPATKFQWIMCTIRSLVNDIYSTTTYLDTEFDTDCNSINILTDNSISILKTSSGTGLSNQHILYYCMVLPKWDCAVAYSGNNIGDLFGIAIGSVEAYCKSKISIMKGNSSDRDRARMCLALFRRERDMTLYICSSDNSILGQIPAELKNISDQFQTNYIRLYTQNYYGYVTPKGGSLNFSRGALDSAIGGTIFFGPISPESLMAAAIAEKLTQDHVVTANSYTSQVATSLVPFAGQSTLRVSSHIFAGSPNTVWSTYISNLKNRYNNGQNPADFSSASFLKLIPDVYSHFCIAQPLTRPMLNDTESAADSILSLNTEGYIHWMQLFEGAFKTLYDLNAYSTDTQTNQIALLQRAGALISLYADVNMTTQIQYIN